MTNTKLVQIQPRELKFTFEVKKQSSCAVRLANITDQFVTFKVKTTSPKKYCVRPNIGVIKPKSTYDFTVTMQAQKTAPTDMLCKDKFLIQSTVVPFGTSDEEITSSMFNKDDGKYIEECKLRVILVSPPNSPVLQQVNGISKQGAPIETSLQQEKFPSGVENLPPAKIVVKNNKDVKFEEETEEPRLGKMVDDIDLTFAKNAESNTDEVAENRKDADFVVEAAEPRFAKAVEDFKLNSPNNKESNINEVVKSTDNVETTKLSLSNDVEDADFVVEAEEPRFAKTVEDVKLNSPKNMESYINEAVKSRHLNVETTKLSLPKDVEELKSKINSLDSQLIEVVKSNKDVKFEGETEGPRLGKMVDDIDLNFAKNTESNTEEVVERVAENRKDEDFVVEAEEPRFAKTVEDIKLNPPTNKESNINEVVKSRDNVETTILSLSNDVPDADFVVEAQKPRFAKAVEDVKLNSPKSMESYINEVVKSRHLNAETTKLSLSKDVEELKSKINSLDSQLIEAECIIAKLKEEERSTTKEMGILRQELALRTPKGVGRRAQVGFPPLFVCMVALICLTVGYLLRA